MTLLLAMALAVNEPYPRPEWITRSAIHSVSHHNQAGRLDSICACRAIAGRDTFYLTRLAPMLRTKIAIVPMNYTSLPQEMQGTPRVEVEVSWGPPDAWRRIEIGEGWTFITDWGQRVIVSGLTGCYRVTHSQWEWVSSP